MRGVRVLVIKSLIFIFLGGIILSPSALAHKTGRDHLSVYSFELEKFSKRELTLLFGEIEAWPRKDKHHDPYLFCYKLNAKDDIWGIFGFTWAFDFDYLGYVRITTDPSVLEGKCGVLDRDPKYFVTPAGLGIGTTKDEVMAMFPYAISSKTFNLQSGFGWFVPVPVDKSGHPTKMIYELKVGVNFVDDLVSDYSLLLLAEPWD